MSWFRDEELKLSWIEKLAINVISQGKIPQHVAIIMDGNRRFSVKSHIQKSEGHKMGFDKLSQALQWCLELQIKEVTVYAFSIENFKRSQEEVDTLMSLATEKFAKLLEEKDKLAEKGVKIQVIGNLKMLPQKLQKSIAESMLLTKDNNKSILNVAFAYTSRDEITNSVHTIVKGVEDKDLQVDDLHHSLIDECLYTNKCSPVDLLVRTSGEMRFSDFLIWQTPATVFYFTNALWPEFTLWHLLAAVFYFQRCYYQTMLVRSHFESKKLPLRDNERVEKFLTKVDEQRTAELVRMKNSPVV